MAKSVPKRQKVGYASFINRFNEKGRWERVGFLFGNKKEALDYLLKNYSGVLKRSVQAVRVSAEKITRHAKDLQ